jgi:hypothetical protein
LSRRFLLSALGLVPGALLLLAACAPAAAAPAASPPPPSASAPVTPPPEPPSDRPRIRFPERMPEDFAFFLAIDACLFSALDTFTGTFLETRLEDASVTTRLVLPTERMEAIYAEVRESDFFNLYDIGPRWDTTLVRAAGRVPPHRFRMVVRADGHVHNLRWSDWKLPGPLESPEWLALMQLSGTVWRAWRATPEFRALPEPNRLCL